MRGYQLERDRYVVIERFVDGAAIDRLYWDEPYYLVPDGKPAQDFYAVIREAMAGEGQVALGRLVMSSRERIVAIEPRGRGMLLSTLHSQSEVRADEEASEDVAEVTIDRRMVEIAKQIIARAKAADGRGEGRPPPRKGGSHAPRRAAG